MLLLGEEMISRFDTIFPFILCLTKLRQDEKNGSMKIVDFKMLIGALT